MSTDPLFALPSGSARPVASSDHPVPALWRPVADDWLPTLREVSERLHELHEALAGEQWLPGDHSVLRAFRLPLQQIRVLIVGQDPYPTPGHPVGLSFSVAPDVRPLPRSLRNILTELVDDVGAPMPEHGDLSVWADQGVMLLNRVLSVRAGASASHHGRGWETVTAAAVQSLADRGGPLVAVLWGRPAQQLQPTLERAGVRCVTSAHPSPLSARRGFFGSKPFSRVNGLLAEQGASPIEWTVPPA